MSRPFALVLAATFLITACAQEAAPPEAATAVIPLPPGDALPTRVDAMLYGSATTCRVDHECPGRVCYFGACIGLLVVDQRWMQTAIGERTAHLARWLTVGAVLEIGIFSFYMFFGFTRALIAYDPTFSEPLWMAASVVGGVAIPAWCLPRIRRAKIAQAHRATLS